MQRLFYSLISLVVSIFFLALGILGLMLPWSPAARTDLIFLILENSTTIALFSLAPLIIGLSIAIHIGLSMRHSYYHLRSGPRLVKVDETILQSYLDIYWKQLFPDREVPNRLTIKRNKIYLMADLPYIPPKEQKARLAQIQEELAQMLEGLLGYRQPLSLSASFQPETRIK